MFNIQADVMQWLEETQEKFDCIFVDPPTFSNTRKKKRVFDIQRDHIRLLTLAMGLLAPEGTLIFSTNFKKFSLDPTLAELYTVDSLDSVPFDFQRSPRIHRCWRFTLIDSSARASPSPSLS